MTIAANTFFLYSQEEMEETGQTTIYDNYKFVTKEDLEKLKMTHLIGTDLLKAQMHGYFVNHNLYKKVILLTFSLTSELPPRCFCFVTLFSLSTGFDSG